MSAVLQRFHPAVLRLAAGLVVTPILIFLKGGWGLLRSKKRARLQNKKDLLIQYPHILAAVAILKNEAAYLQEWIEYHRIQGITKFLLYDNGSTDNPASVLRRYIESGLVELIPYPGKIMQVKAYTDSLLRLRDCARWVAFIDLDEFIVPTEGKKSIVEMVDEIMTAYPHAGGIAIGWWMFGSSHHEHRPEGLVIENYLHRADAGFMRNIKTIGNPRLMLSFSSPHYPNYEGIICNVNENGQNVRTPFDFEKSTCQLHINHYFTKSKEECMAKIAKGIATVGTPRTEAIFFERDRNEIYDDSMLKYAEMIKHHMAENDLGEEL